MINYHMENRIHLKTHNIVAFGIEMGLGKESMCRDFSGTPVHASREGAVV